MVEEMIKGVDGEDGGDMQLNFVEFIKLWNENFE